MILKHTERTYIQDDILWSCITVHVGIEHNMILELYGISVTAYVEARHSQAVAYQVCVIMLIGTGVAHNDNLRIAIVRMIYIINREIGAYEFVAMGLILIDTNGYQENAGT